MPINIAGYRWSKSAGRYIDARGRFVSIDAIRLALDKALAQNQKRIAGLATGLQAGNISLEQWRSQMRLAIKDAHLYSAAAARGGWAQMSARDLGRVGQRVRYNYGRLERFAGQIARGEINLDGRFIVRAGLYAGNAKTTYHVVEVEAQRAAGYDEERNRLRPADHCDECVELTRAGWVPIGSTKPIGSRECLGNCQCGMDYRRSGDSPSASEPDTSEEMRLRAELDALRRAPIGRGASAVQQRNREVYALEQKISAVIRAQTAPVPQNTSRRDAIAASEPGIMREAAALETKWRRNDFESGAIWGADGRLILQKKGSKTRVHFTAEESRLAEGAALFTHNHPGGATFSSGDFAFLEFQGVETVRAVGVDRSTGRAVDYELRRNPKGRDRYDAAFQRKLRRVYSNAEVQREVDRRINSDDTGRPREGESIAAWRMRSQDSAERRVAIWNEILHERLEALLRTTDRYIYTRTFN